MTRALAIAFALVLAGGVARAEPSARAATEARRHLQRGNTLYQQGRYDEAVVELRAGYALDPRPDFLYAIGQAERKRGDCKAAIRYYQDYVNTGQSPQRTVAVLMQIDRCKEELAAAPVTPSQPPPASAEPPAPAEPATPPPAIATPEPATTAPPSAPPSAGNDKPVYKRWWLWTIVGVGVAGAAVGLGVGLTQSQSFHSTLPDLVVGNAAVRF